MSVFVECRKTRIEIAYLILFALLHTAAGELHEPTCARVQADSWGDRGACSTCLGPM